MVEEDHIENKFEDQEMEIEALQCIFQDDIEVYESTPYKLKVRINSNGDGKEKNNLFLDLKIDWPPMYPDVKPILHIKNLVIGILDNNHINKYEEMMEAKMEELVGTPMIFEICDMIREEISALNDIILGEKMVEEKKHSVEEGLKAKTVSKHLTYTPVNSETFGEWCVGYYKEILKKKEAAKTAMDLKPTGKQLFMEKYGEGNFAEITEDDIAEEAKREDDEEDLGDEEDIEETEEGIEGNMLYDRDQFAAELEEEGLEEDEPDFD
jgi:hypothetical protein